ncbi:T-lymphocyte activation antigen CD86-like [Sebastes umbrosus]|uniref:T-lymphocyte activation antigen CD86-like n=1 Tax=Sebastes umbrosus TaxID=72105 RepID=UPI00189F515E|nr:T-lymphocyte activation antigen CD86-like [Sebastes umbrosus]XP_037644760.1 T-lymphocyte activation antigen CD86-like [Sebastes umbrosus]
MFSVLVAYFLLLVSDATVVLDVNTTVGESTVLPCNLAVPATIGLRNLRFSWQDERKYVLYSFNRGRERPEYVNGLYRGRVTAFPRDMIVGNISVTLQNITLEDNQKVFQAYAAVLDSGGTGGYILPLREICQITLHVAVAYERINLAVNEDTRTAVCTHRGFPKPLLTWRLQNLSDPQHFLDARDVHTTAVQDPQDHLYSIRSTADISGGPYRSIICLIHNPTLNVTLNTTHILNKGGAERSLPGRTAVLILAAVVLNLS